MMFLCPIPLPPRKSEEVTSISAEVCEESSQVICQKLTSPISSRQGLPMLKPGIDCSVELLLSMPNTLDQPNNDKS